MARKLVTATFQCGWVEDPVPGADAVSYDIDISPDAWCLNADGSTPFTSTSGRDWPAVRFYRTIGNTREDVTTRLTELNLQTYCECDGVSVPLSPGFIAGTYILRPANASVGYKSVRVALTGKDASGNTIQLAAKNCSISQAGVQGDPGPFTPPPMQWADYTTGFRFTDGTEGTAKHVVLHGFAANGRAMCYCCKKSHNKVPNNAANTTGTEPGTTPGSEYWQTVDGGPFHLLATDVLLAVNAFINFLSGNAIRLYDATGANIVGEIMGGSGILAWLGGSSSNPMWAVDVQGMQTLGGRSGQRIELDPSEREMRIFDSSGNLCGVHSGRSIGSNPVPGSGTNTTSEANIASATKTKSGHAEVGNYSQATTYTAGEMTVSIPAGGTTEITVPKMHYEMRTIPGSSSVPAAAKVYLEPRVKVYNGTTLVNTFTLEGVSHTGGGSKTVDCPSRTFYQSGAITKIVLEMMCDVVNTAGLSGEFKWDPANPGDKLKAAFKIKRYRCEFGSDGMVVSYDNSNYFYLRHDGTKLVGKFVSNGNTIFST